MSLQVSLPSFYRLVRHECIASTSDEAKALAQQGEPAGTLVWARTQMAGRGRQGRNWISPAGNFYASLILRPPVPVATAAQLGFVAAIAVVDACLAFAPEAAISLKWPNDVLLAGRKLAGLLLESRSCGDGMLDWLVLGIGLNLATYPVEIEYPATALAGTGADTDPEAMLSALAASFLAWYERWREGAGFATIRAEWLARAQGLGQPIRVRLPGEIREGVFGGLDTDGALLLDTETGRQRIAAGEVFPAIAV
ncbi:MAG TPA: biotin--[acetyl-CoA-carboxylase] ligase [Stellaceae bacterium]|jgi:BirA family biotin operon repressor/biotin-[acetyl-CoA-carboxylase] ligase|nr:biotin--[acetyl-CoA-carboxylase] ligase [Stellaceae bacterium]